MDGYEYERKCATLLKAKGFSNVTVTKSSCDQGIDIIAYKKETKYGIQCKYYTGVVGNKAIQEAYAGAAYYGCKKSIVITNSVISKSALQLSNELDVDVWEHIDAIYLQKNSQKLPINYDGLTKEEKEDIQLKEIEEYLQEKYNDFYIKYPRDINKSIKISEYIRNTRKNLRNLETTYRHELTHTLSSIIGYGIIKSYKDPKVILAKNEAREHLKKYVTQLKIIFDEVDAKAKQYISTSFSVEEINKLIDLLLEVIDYGDDISISLGKQIVARFTWSEKYLRIAYNWKKFKEELPNNPQESDHEKEKKQKEIQQSKLDDAKKTLNEVRENIKNIENNIKTETNRLEKIKSKLKVMNSNNPIENEKLRINFNETEIKLKNELNVNKELLYKLQIKREEKTKELNNLFILALKQKYILKNDINNLENKISDIEQSCVQIEKDLVHAKIFYETHTQALKDRIDDFEFQIEEIERTIKKDKEKIKNEKNRKNSLEYKIKTMEKQLQNFHKFYLLENYKSKIIY